ncbi:hypothetical protein BGZ76_001680 [Entomortierella beljakovae]|nr:hypothetical protein BGZ76_001680 [Entomortierella beljakovae]
MNAAFKTIELLSANIANSLEQKHLKTCMLVCQQWALEFRPHLWYKITITQNVVHILPKELFQKYAYLVRELDVCDPMFLINNWFSPSVCCNLIRFGISPTLSQKRLILAAPARGKVKSLHFDQDLEFLSLKSVNKSIELIQANPNLQILTEHWHTLTFDHTQLAMENLCNLRTNLTEIQGRRWQLSSFDLIHTLLKNSPRLRRLQLFGGAIDFSNPNDNDSEGSGELEQSSVLNDSNPQSIILDLGELRHLTMIEIELKDSSKTAQCSIKVIARNLESLKILGCRAGLSRYYYPAAFVLRVSSWEIPNLRELAVIQFDRHPGQFPVKLINAVDSLESFTLTHCLVQSAIIPTLLHRHSKSLQKINLRYNIETGLVGKDIVSILMSCPNLREFWGPYSPLLATDAIQQPWACKQLEKLSIYLEIPLELVETPGLSKDVSQSRLNERMELFKSLYTHLSTLTQLKEIVIAKKVPLTDYQLILPWTLKAGLGQLNKLSEMKSILVTGQMSDIGMEEVEWFKKYWPSLKEIRCDRPSHKTMDPSVQEALGDIVTMDPSDNAALIESVKPKSYRGAIDGIACRSFIDSQEGFLELVRPSKTEWVEYTITNSLEDEAMVWWHNSGMTTTTPWDTFKRDFIKVFSPINFESSIRNEFIHLKQGNTSIEEYTMKFRQLLYLIPQTDKETALYRYLEGLDPNTKLQVQLQLPDTLQNAISKAAIIHNILYPKHR